MKKLLALFLACVMCLGLCGCGDSESDTPSNEETKMTKEEMLKISTAADIIEMNNALVDNVVNAKQTYCGKVLEMKAPIQMIRDDSIILSQGQNGLIAYLPEENIADFQAGQWITIVGLTNDDITKETQTAFGTEWEFSYFVMEQAYFVTDRYEYVGTPKSKNDSYTGAWNVAFGNDPYLKLVYFDASTDVSPYVGKEITFSAQVIDGNYHNAVVTAVPQEAPTESRLTSFSYEDREFFKEYVANLEPMSGDAVEALLTDTTFSMRNNYGGDGDGTHTITFLADGSLDATYMYDGKEYSMYQSWRIEKSNVVCTNSFTNNFGEAKTVDTSFTPYQFDETRYLLIDADGDNSMVLTTFEG